MELFQLKYFKIVAECGKIATAAERLFVSPPAISTSISKLEKELGVQLFERENNRITLNRQGVIFLKYANQILSIAECAKEDVQRSLLHETPHVCIAVTTSDLWVDLIAAFSQEYSDFALSSTTLKVSQFAEKGLAPNCAFLLADESDIPPELEEAYDSVVLFDDQPTILVNPAHPFASRASVDLHELMQERLFTPMKDQSLFCRLTKLFTDNRIPFPDTHSYSSQICRNMVTQNLGVAFSSDHAKWQTSFNLCNVAISNPHRAWTQRLYWPKNRKTSANELVFKEFVEEYYNVSKS